MIYDMGGFPPELYQVRYDAPGSSEIAEEIIDVITSIPFCHTDEGSICYSESDKSPADSSPHSE